MGRGDDDRRPARPRRGPLARQRGDRLPGRAAHVRPRPGRGGAGRPVAARARAAARRPRRHPDAELPRLRQRRVRLRAARRAVRADQRPLQGARALARAPRRRACRRRHERPDRRARRLRSAARSRRPGAAARPTGADPARRVVPLRIRRPGRLRGRRRRRSRRGGAPGAAAREAPRRGDDDVHVGHDRAAEGLRDHPRGARPRRHRAVDPLAAGADDPLLEPAADVPHGRYLAAPRPHGRRRADDDARPTSTPPACCG